MIQWQETYWLADAGSLFNAISEEAQTIAMALGN